VFFKPGHWSDVWVTTMGGGLWEGRTLSGTAAPEETLNLKVWPNPIAAGGMLHVEIRENQTLWLGLRDVSGKLIKTADLHTPGQFSLEGIAPGVYWLEWRMGGVYVGGEKVLVR
ncbi:MAG: T9SS type A sorting domain-containing protein, partial [Saprospiraceae bacterium]|nr:T9SS type A sorting domain-containing protein [Saprospiraceae bacterium]